MYTALCCVQQYTYTAVLSSAESLLRCALCNSSDSELHSSTSSTSSETTAATRSLSVAAMVVPAAVAAAVLAVAAVAAAVVVVAALYCAAITKLFTMPALVLLSDFSQCLHL
jgi:hypothetical protein